MRIVQAPRAASILYRILAARAAARPWLLPANICPIVPLTFLKARVPFCFVDISAATLNMDLDRAEALVATGAFGGLLYAHTYGEASTPDDFFAALKAAAPELVVVDDRCLCTPELEPASSADVILNSTGYAKIVELNAGGYAFVAERIDCPPVSLPFAAGDLEQLERRYKEAVSRRAPFTYRDSDWLDCGSSVPPWREYAGRIAAGRTAALARRAALNARYERLLPEELQLPARYQTWRFTIRVRDKARVLGAIFAAGLFAGSHYASLAGIMAEGSAPEAEALADEAINLFNDHHVDERHVRDICAVIKRNL